MSQPWEPTECLTKITTEFGFEFITEDIVRRMISEIKTSKSSAIDNLSSKILKDSFSVLIIELTYLYNKCIEMGIFPRLKKFRFPGNLTLTVRCFLVIYQLQ